MILKNIEICKYSYYLAHQNFSFGILIKSVVKEKVLLLFVCYYFIATKVLQIYKGNNKWENHVCVRENKNLQMYLYLYVTLTGF